MGCKTILFELPGNEYMDRLVDKGLAVLHRQGDSLAALFLQADAIDLRFGSEEMFGHSRGHSSCAS